MSTLISTNGIDNGVLHQIFRGNVSGRVGKQKSNSVAIWDSQLTFKAIANTENETGLVGRDLQITVSAAGYQLLSFRARFVAGKECNKQVYLSSSDSLGSHLPNDDFG